MFWVWAETNTAVPQIHITLNSLSKPGVNRRPASEKEPESWFLLLFWDWQTFKLIALLIFTMWKLPPFPKGLFPLPCFWGYLVWYSLLWIIFGIWVLGVLVPIVIRKQVADKTINIGNRELTRISRYSHSHGWMGKQAPRGHVACPKPEELQRSRVRTCSQVCLTLTSTQEALGVLKLFFFLNFLYFTVCIIKTFKKIWGENISPGCSLKNPFFKGPEIKFILFSCSGFHFHWIVCTSYLSLIITVVVTSYFNELGYTVISLSAPLSWTPHLKNLFYSSVNYFLKMNPQKWSDWLRQMNIFMALDFYCQIAFQGGCISLQGQGSLFFSGPVFRAT